VPREEEAFHVYGYIGTIAMSKQSETRFTSLGVGPVRRGKEQRHYGGQGGGWACQTLPATSSSSLTLCGPPVSGLNGIFEVASNICPDHCPPRHPTEFDQLHSLADIARRPIHRMPNPRLLIQLATYGAASNVCQAHSGGRQVDAHSFCTQQFNQKASASHKLHHTL